MLLLFDDEPLLQDVLLETTRHLAEGARPGDCEVAVAAAQMAIEIQTERALGALFEIRDLQFVEDSVTDLISTYSLNNDRVRNLYESLSGDDIVQAPFWQRFKDHAKRRNEVVHSGKRVSKQEAADSAQVAGDLVAHLREVIGRLRPTS
jgi:hypothetical protein